MDHMNAQYHAHWMKLMSSDWFSILLPYLNLKDIANVDTAFCNHMDRPVWLNLLNDHIVPSVEIVNNRGLKKMTDWFISKHINLDKLSFKYTGTLDSHEVVSDETVSRLTQNSPCLKKLKIENRFTRFTVNKMLFPCITMFCTQIESLDTYNADIPNNGIESMSKTCHQLKHLKLLNAHYTGILELLKTNRQLLSLNLRLYSSTNAFIFGDILEILGLHCPLLEICQIYRFTAHFTDIQIETFTKGCPNLKDIFFI